MFFQEPGEHNLAPNPLKLDGKCSDFCVILPLVYKELFLYCCLANTGLADLPTALHL